MPNTTTKPVRKPATKDHLKKRGRPRTDLALFLDSEAEAEVDKWSSKLRMLTMMDGSDDEIKEAQEKLEDATDRRDKSAVYLTFESIGRKKYKALVEEHPPTEEQIKEYKEEHATYVDGKKVPATDAPDYNVDTFPLDLISRCLVEPKLTVPELEELLEDWNDAEYVLMFQTAMMVNSKSKVEYWGNSYG